MSAAVLRGLLRRSLRFSDLLANIGGSYISHFKSKNSVWLGFVLGALMLQVVTMFTVKSLPSSSATMLTTATILSVGVYFYPYFETTYRYVRCPEKLFLALSTSVQRQRMYGFLDGLFRSVSLSPAVFEAQYTPVVFDEKRQLSAKFYLDTILVEAFEPDFDSGYGAVAGPQNFWVPVYEFLDVLKERADLYETIPASHRFLLLCPQYSVEQIQQGIGLGLKAETFVGFIKHEVPVEQWDDLKDYPVEWVVAVV